MNEFEMVKNLIKESLKVDDENITMDTDLFEDLDIDSLDAVELVVSIEEECGVKIPDEEISNLHTVGDIVNYIESHK